MKILNKALAIFCSVILFSQFIRAQSAFDILTKVEQNIRTIQYLHYKCHYLPRNSIPEETGEVWLERIPSDSIFSSHFHIKGKAKFGINGGKNYLTNYEYFYDGKTSIEIRDIDTSMTIFYPNKYPNDMKNPAKSQIAALPLIYLLIDENFKSDLLKNNPQLSLDSVSNNWIIKLLYTKQNGTSKTEKLFINKNSFLISKIEDKWNTHGHLGTVNISIENYLKNKYVDKNKITLIKNYNGYKRIYDKDRRKSFHIIGKNAPKFNFKSYNGHSITLGQYKGKIVVLEFRENWCSHCLLSFPEMNEFQKKYEKEEVKLIGITTDNEDEVKKLINYNKLNYTNIFASKNILKEYEITAWPTFILINKEGKIIFADEGYLNKIKEKINQLIKN
jgi:peroxiredoxin